MSRHTTSAAGAISLALAAVLMAGAQVAFPHPGTLAKDGCHFNRKLGVRHCHPERAKTAAPEPRERKRNIEATGVPEVFEALVVGVSDGDTLKVLTADKREIRVRLHGVDCPESRQAHGKAAKRFASDLVYKKRVTLTRKDVDQYGRLVAVVGLSDGRSLNEELLRAGWAWDYKQFSKSERYASLEKAARAAGLGLWAASEAPVAPWEWRRANKRNKMPVPLKVSGEGPDAT